MRTFTYLRCLNSGMHKIRPAGQMCPAEAFYLARKAQHFIHKAFFLEKTPSILVKTYRFWPFDKLKKIWTRLSFELYTPVLIGLFCCKVGKYVQRKCNFL